MTDRVFTMEQMMYPEKHGLKVCSHCNGYGSSMKEGAETCTVCGGCGVVPSLDSPAQKLEELNKYNNFYHCSECNTDWQDQSPYTNNDRCPNCNTEMEPYDSKDISE